MVTSRVATRVAGEHRFVLDPLPVHGTDHSGMGSDAMVLLVERAEAMCPGWAGGERALRCAAELAVDLDGLALALELAAARAALLGPCALRERLRGKLAGLDAATVDAAARHRSLHAAITWSYELLPVQAREVLCQLSVFRGTIALDAAVSVTQLDEDELLEQLATLVDASLLRSLHDDPPSFRLLETIRAFAAERLAHDAAEIGTQARHAEFFRALGESAAPRLWEPQQQAWFDRLEREHDNLRAALQFWLGHGGPVLALRLATSLAPFWEANGHLEEGLEWLDQVLAAARDADPATRGWAMFYAARVAAQRGEAERASALLQDSLRLFRQGADMRGEIFALSHLGNAAAQRDAVPEAFDLGAQSVERARELGDPWYLAMALNNYGYSRVMSGNVEDLTDELLAESLRLRRSLDEKRGVGFTLGSIAELQLLRGDLDAATATVEEMLTLSAALTHAELTCITFNLHGFLHLGRSNPALAQERFRESLQRSYRMGFQLLIGEALLGLGEAAAQQGDFTRALRFAVVARRALIAEEQQPATFHQAAISRIERHLQQALDPAAQQTIRTAAETVTPGQLLAEAEIDLQDLQFRQSRKSTRAKCNRTPRSEFDQSIGPTAGQWSRSAVLGRRACCCRLRNVAKVRLSSPSRTADQGQRINSIPAAAAGSGYSILVAKTRRHVFGGMILDRCATGGYTLVGSGPTAIRFSLSTLHFATPGTATATTTTTRSYRSAGRTPASPSAPGGQSSRAQTGSSGTTAGSRSLQRAQISRRSCRPQAPAIRTSWPGHSATRSLTTRTAAR